MDKVHELKYHLLNAGSAIGAVISAAIDQWLLALLAVIGWFINTYWNIRIKRGEERRAEEKHRLELDKLKEE